MAVSKKQASVSAANAAITGNATATFGANTTVGSKLIAICSAQGAVVPTPPSGWVQLKTLANASITTTIFEMTKVATAATQYVFGGFGTTANTGNVVLMELAGADVNAPAVVSSEIVQATGTTVSCPTLYPLVAGAALVSGYGGAGNGSAADASVVSSGWTLDTRIQNSTSGIETLVATLLSPTLGTPIIPAPYQFKPTTSNALPFVAFSILVNPTLGSGSPVASIALTPNPASVVSYAHTQFTATATLSDASTANLLGYATFAATTGNFASAYGYGFGNTTAGTTVPNANFANASGIYNPSAAASAAPGTTDTVTASYAGVTSAAVTITVAAISNPNPPAIGSTAPPVLSIVPTRSVSEVPVWQGTREMDAGTYTSGGASDLGGTGAIVMAVSIPANGIRLLYANYGNTGTGETTAAYSTLTFKASIQYPADVGVPIAVTFNGSRTATLDPGGYIYSDPIELDNIPAALTATTVQVGIRTFVQVASGGAFPTGPHGQNYVAGGTGPLQGFGGVVQPAIGTAGCNYPQNSSGAGTDQTLTTGAVSAWYSSNNVYTFGPLAAVGVPADGVPRPVVAVTGDSISNGSIDTLTGSSGFQVRAFCGANIPHYMMARGNESFASFSGVLAQRRMLRMDRCTHATIAYGANDVLGLMFAQLRTNCLNIVQQVANRNVITFLCTVIPRLSQAAQTPSQMTFPSFAQNIGLTDSVRQAFNAWLRAPASAGAGNSATYDIVTGLGIATFAGVFDTAALCEVDVNNSFSLTGGRLYCGPQNNTSFVADGGTHPSSAGHAAMATAIQTAKILAPVGSNTTPPAPHFFGN